MNQNTKKEKDFSKKEKPQSIFAGISFKGKPVSKEEYIAAYQEYVKRCAAN